MCSWLECEVLPSPPRWMKAGRLFQIAVGLHSFDHLPSPASSLVSSDGCSVPVSLLFSIMGNAGRESYYHGFFNSLAASPGSIITPAVGSSLPFILLSFLLPPELPTKSAESPEGRVWCFQTLCVPRWTPTQERVSVNPLAGGSLHTQEIPIPGHPALWRQDRD